MKPQNLRQDFLRPAKNLRKDTTLGTINQINHTEINRMEARYQEITIGEQICKKLKDIHFNDVPWSECYKDVAEKFSALKVIARKFYANKDELEMLKELAKYSIMDIKEMYNCST